MQPRVSCRWEHREVWSRLPGRYSIVMHGMRGGSGLAALSPRISLQGSLGCRRWSVWSKRRDRTGWDRYGTTVHHNPPGGLTVWVGYHSQFLRGIQMYLTWRGGHKGGTWKMPAYSSEGCVGQTWDLEPKPPSIIMSASFSSAQQ